MKLKKEGLEGKKRRIDKRNHRRRQSTSQMTSVSLSRTIKLLLICICYLSLATHFIKAGGKGKVPVYMPIPIPVPMPMSGSGGQGGAKFSHHHGDGGHNNGEVKKIYLLQPIPKTGGHYNQQPAIQQHQQPQQHIEHQQKGGQSEMKILPIVMIPPIAPMPPIQVQQAPANQLVHTPRMTLSPQFNNYLVSSSNEDARKHRHYVSEYGGSGGGQLYRRAGARLRGRASTISTNAVSSGRLIGLDFMPRTRVRIREEIIGHDDDDYSDYNPNSFRSMASRSLAPPGRYSVAASNRRRWREVAYPDDRDRSRPINTNSIRDVMDQQNENRILFDDEPNNGLTEESRNSEKRHQSKQSQEAHDWPFDLVNSEQQRKDVSAVDRDYLAQSPPSKDSSLNSLYYDRDYQSSDPESASVAPARFGSNRYISGGTKRLYLDEKELLNDEDEWRFDSIKSITHANPATNATVAATSFNANATNIGATGKLKEPTTKPNHTPLMNN